MKNHDAKPGYLFSKVGLHESGDYLLLGSGSQADVTGQIRVFRKRTIPLTNP